MFTAIARGWNLRAASVVTGGLCAASIPQSNIPLLPDGLRSKYLQAASRSCLTYTHNPSPIFSLGTGEGVSQRIPFTSSVQLASTASHPFYRPGDKSTLSVSLTWNGSIYPFGTLEQSMLWKNKVHVRVSSEKEVPQITAKRIREEPLDSSKKENRNKAARRDEWLRCHKRPSDQKQLSKAVISTDPIAVVFFHGLAQDKDYSKVWVNVDGEFWPKWLWESFPEAKLLEVRYAAYDRIGGPVTLESFAEALLDGILSETDEDRPWWKMPTVLVGHGVGGIVIRALICAAVDRKEKDHRSAIFLENVKGVVYYSTPAFPKDFDEGCLTLLSDAIYRKLGQSHVSSGDRTGKILSEIIADCTSIRVILNRFRSDIAREHLEQIRKGSKALFETHKTEVQGHFHRRFKGNVVLEGPRFADEAGEYRKFHKALKVEGRDHFTICKPTNKEDYVYKVVYKLVKDILVPNPDA